MRKYAILVGFGLGIGLLLPKAMTKDISQIGILYGVLLLIGIIILSDIDIRTKEIPNPVLLYFLGMAILRMVFDFRGVINHVAGFLIMGGLLLAIAVLTGGKLGGGDIKLMALAGLCLGLRDVFLALAIGSMVGSVVGLSLIMSKVIKKEDAIPFGPFLGIGIYLAYLYGQDIWNWYMR